MTAHVHRLHDDSLLVDVRDVECEAHAERVHPSTTFQDQRAFDLVAAEETDTPWRAVASLFRRRPARVLQ